ncbi:hypothetical protein TcasGA2_TC031912 [Tribolium castaneum]|uniref:CCHC-type domain-containing protein n=1 Tax=Tribolium castaneum TaxID=7070 RepID=A0A139W8K3_TRICA|nr:hypothetical protein TcasGA2_TC031912 [Tribolium castaneum]
MDADELIKEVSKQEDLPENIPKNFVKSAFKVGNKDGKSNHWVIEVHPAARNYFIKSGSRVYVSWKSLHIRDYLRVTRCFKCQKFGHVSKFCNSEKQCGYCSGTYHESMNCKVKNEEAKHKCSICIRSEQQEVNHCAGLDLTSIKDEVLQPLVDDLVSLLGERFSTIDSIPEIEKATKELYGGLAEIFLKYGKKRKNFVGRPDWWNEELERFRKIYLAKKTLFYRNRFREYSDHLFAEMTRAKQTFEEKVEKRRQKCWLEFAENDLARKPWGVVYKLASQKFKTRGILLHSLVSTIRDSQAKIPKRRSIKEASVSFKSLLGTKTPGSDLLGPWSTISPLGHPIHFAEDFHLRPSKCRRLSG